VIYGVVVSSPPETDAGELTRILADTVVVVRDGAKTLVKSSLAPLAMGRRVSGGVFLVWTFPTPFAGAAHVELDPPRTGWGAILHDDPKQLQAFARQARLQWEETEKSARKRDELYVSSPFGGDFCF